MNAHERHNARRALRAYQHGLDVLGFGIGDIASFVPALAIVQKLVDTGGGASGTPAQSVIPGSPGAAGPAGASPAAVSPSAAATKGLVDEAVRQALFQQKAQAKAEADAARSRKILYGVLAAVGVAGVGGTIYMLRRK
jgi:hypothetical protein